MTAALDASVSRNGGSRAGRASGRVEGRRPSSDVDREDIVQHHLVAAPAVMLMLVRVFLAMCPSTVAIPWARGFVEPKRFPRAQGRSGTNLFQTTVTKQAVLLSSSFVRDAFRGILRVRVLSAEGPAGRYRPRDRVEDAGRPERPWRAEGLVWANLFGSGEAR